MNNLPTENNNIRALSTQLTILAQNGPENSNKPEVVKICKGSSFSAKANELINKICGVSQDKIATIRENNLNKFQSDLKIQYNIIQQSPNNKAAWARIKLICHNILMLVPEYLSYDESEVAPSASSPRSPLIPYHKGPLAGKKKSNIELAIALGNETILTNMLGIEENGDARRLLESAIEDLRRRPKTSEKSEKNRSKGAVPIINEVSLLAEQQAASFRQHLSNGNSKTLRKWLDSEQQLLEQNTWLCFDYPQMIPTVLDYLDSISANILFDEVFGLACSRKKWDAANFLTTLPGFNSLSVKTLKSYLEKIPNETELKRKIVLEIEKKHEAAFEDYQVANMLNLMYAPLAQQPSPSTISSIENRQQQATSSKPLCPAPLHNLSRFAEGSEKAVSIVINPEVYKQIPQDLKIQQIQDAINQRQEVYLKATLPFETDTALKEMIQKGIQILEQQQPIRRVRFQEVDEKEHPKSSRPIAESLRSISSASETQKTYFLQHLAMGNNDQLFHWLKQQKDFYAENIAYCLNYPAVIPTVVRFLYIRGNTVGYRDLCETACSTRNEKAAAVLINLIQFQTLNLEEIEHLAKLIPINTALKAAVESMINTKKGNRGETFESILSALESGNSAGLNEIHQKFTQEQLIEFFLNNIDADLDDLFSETVYLELTPLDSRQIVRLMLETIIKNRDWKKAHLFALTGIFAFISPASAREEFIDQIEKMELAKEHEETIERFTCVHNEVLLDEMQDLDESDEDNSPNSPPS